MVKSSLCVKSEVLKESVETKVPELNALVKFSLLKLESLKEFGELNALVKFSLLKLESLNEFVVAEIPELDKFFKSSLGVKSEALKELGVAEFPGVKSDL